MKIKSQKIIGRNGKIREHFVNKFNSKGLIERTEYFDENGKQQFYSEFNYDLNDNCILKKEFDADNIIQSSNLWEFDKQNREIKFIELTAENLIWEWYEKQYPDENTIVYLSKDENGEVIHKTIENIETGEQKRFRNEDNIYATIKEEFDEKNRLTNRKTIDEKGIVIEENQYSYIGTTEFWKLFIDGKYIKTEERTNDRKRNLEFYIRKDKNGKSLEWLKREYDDFGNVISIENGIKVDKPTNKSIIEIEYWDGKNAC